MYKRLKEELHDKGEMMIRFTSGEEAELHLHNTEFVEEPFIKVDADDEIHWFNAEEVERYYIHKEF